MLLFAPSNIVWLWFACRIFHFECQVSFSCAEFRELMPKSSANICESIFLLTYLWIHSIEEFSSFAQWMNWNFITPRFNIISRPELHSALYDCIAMASWHRWHTHKKCILCVVPDIRYLIAIDKMTHTHKNRNSQNARAIFLKWQMFCSAANKRSLCALTHT